MKELLNEMTVAEAHEKGICINCRKPPTWYSPEGAAEYAISGICEPCFDALFDESECVCDIDGKDACSVHYPIDDGEDECEDEVSG